MKRDIIFSPLSAKATKIMLLGAGELGKEIIIEAQRLGFFTIASTVMKELQDSKLRTVFIRESERSGIFALGD